MSVLTNVLKQKDTKVEEIPETETPSAEDLNEVKHAGQTAPEPDTRELSVDESDPAVVSDAIAALEASDPNETANVDPSLVLEDTMVNTHEEFSATPAVTSNNPEAFLEASEPDSDSDSRQGIAADARAYEKASAQPELETAVEPSAELGATAAAAPLNRANHRKLALAGGLLAGVIAAAAYLFFVALPDDSLLAPADTFATPEFSTEPEVLAAGSIDRAEDAQPETEVRPEPALEPETEPDLVAADTSLPAARVTAQPESAAPIQARFAPLHTVETAVEDNPVRISGGIEINRQRRDDPVFVGLSRAYAAYIAGDEASAADFYRGVVELEPNNRDALLGLASLAQSGGRFEEARFYFESLLELDPKDGVAATGLMSIQQQTDSVADESALKSMLREQPEAAHLHFGLGMRYVEQGRWPDAQTAFFDAVRFAPDHPDYSFNLAVSLDRLGKTSSAAIYYELAIDNANGLQSFDVAQAQARLNALNGG